MAQEPLSPPLSEPCHSEPSLAACLEVESLASAGPWPSRLSSSSDSVGAAEAVAAVAVATVAVAGAAVEAVAVVLSAAPAEDPQVPLAAPVAVASEACRQAPEYIT